MNQFMSKRKFGALVATAGHTDYARIQYMKLQNRPSAERRLLMTFHGRAPGALQKTKKHGKEGNFQLKR
eukprot:2575571-Amphidinium_carterae.1